MVELQVCREADKDGRCEYPTERGGDTVKTSAPSHHPACRV